MRKIPLTTGNIYHIYNKSISGFKIFKHISEYQRFKQLLAYYKAAPLPVRFSLFSSQESQKSNLTGPFLAKENLVEILAYCTMPTHFHLILKQLKDNGISLFMQNVLNSYSRYFNIKIERKGPLWQERFQNKLVNNQEQLLYLSKYLHLNPVSAGLKENPQDWPHSSYHYYLNQDNDEKEWLSSIFNYIDIDPELYQEFVNSGHENEKTLTVLKKIIPE